MPRCGRRSPSRAADRVGRRDALADRAPLLRDDAVAGGLVDRIGFRDEAYGRIAELAGAQDISGAPDDKDAPPRLYLSRYARADARHVARPRRPGPQVQADDRRGHPGRTDRQRPRRSSVARRWDRRARAVTPSPPRCGRRPPMTTSRPSCCGSTVPAVRSPDRRPSGAKSCAPATAASRSWRRWARSRRPAATTCRWPPTRSWPTRAPSPVRSAWSPASWWPGISRTAWASAPIRCAPTPMPTRGRSTRRSPTSSTHRSRPRPTCSTPTSCERVAQGRDMSVEAVDDVARGRVWTGADATRAGPGRRTRRVAHRDPARQGARRTRRRRRGQDRRATRVRRCVDMLRPKPSSQPAAASLPDGRRRSARPAVAGLVGQARAFGDRRQRAVAGGVALLDHRSRADVDDARRARRRIVLDPRERRGRSGRTVRRAANRLPASPVRADTP